MKESYKKLSMRINEWEAQLKESLKSLDNAMTKAMGLELEKEILWIADIVIGVGLIVYGLATSDVLLIVTGGIMAGAPFDHFADLLRGTRGIVMDMYRQPAKLHEAMDRWLNLLLMSIKDFPMTPSPICMMPLHKGDDTFMSDKQFDEFYWPTLRKVLMAMIEEGLVPMPFAEGRYTNRLKQIADTPKSGVVWYFDQTDMAEAKRLLGDVSCIVGNVPTSVVMTGTVEQVMENCRKLIEACAPGGGYILSGGASVDKGEIENLRAMMDAAKEYGVYK